MTDLDDRLRAFRDEDAGTYDLSTSAKALAVHHGLASL